MGYSTSILVKVPLTTFKLTLGLLAILLGLAEMDRQTKTCRPPGFVMNDDWRRWGFRGAGEGEMREMACFEVYYQMPGVVFLGIMNSINRLVARDPKMSYFTDLDFYWPGHHKLVDNYDKVRAEAEALVAHKGSLPSYQDVDPGMARIDPANKWRVLVLKFYDDWTPNCKYAPETTAILKTMPEVKAAMFSIMAPGQIIPPHCGPFCASLRAHFPLVVPEGDQVFISVDNVKHRWIEGRPLLFDDTYEHWVVNNASSHRIVLFMDVLRRPQDGLWGKLVTAFNEAVVNSPITASYFKEYSRGVEIAQSVNRQPVDTSLSHKLSITRSAGEPLGLDMSNITGQITVTAVHDGPAKRAGIKLGWTCAEVAGISVETVDDVIAVIADAGTDFSMTFKELVTK